MIAKIKKSRVRNQRQLYDSEGQEEQKNRKQERKRQEKERKKLEKKQKKGKQQVSDSFNYCPCYLRFLVDYNLHNNYYSTRHVPMDSKQAA